MQDPLSSMVPPRVGEGSERVNHQATAQRGAAAVVDLAGRAAADLGVALAPQLPAWARSPDVYVLILQLRSGGVAARAPDGLDLAHLSARLQLLWRLECFPKPLVSLLDDRIDASVAGLTTFGTHRVAGENYQFALPLPEDLSVVPAAGIAHALARLPEPLWRDLALGGRSIGRAEAWAVGLVTHCIPASAFPAIVAALADGQPIDPLLDSLHEAPVPLPGGSAVPVRVAVGDASVRRAATEKLILNARNMDVRESLIATYRVASALSRATGAADSFLIDSLFLHPEPGDFDLPLRSELDNGRF